MSGDGEEVCGSAIWVTPCVVWDRVYMWVDFVG